MNVNNSIRQLKKSKLALVAMILTGLYLVYSVWYWSGVLGNTGIDDWEYAGGAIAAALVGPHLLAIAIGFIFNCCGYFMNKRGFILVAAILYAVSIVLFIAYFMFMIVQMILCFVAFAKMPKQSENNMQTYNTNNYSNSSNTEKINVDIINELKEYQELCKEGTITQEEFEKKKKQLLDL